MKKNLYTREEAIKLILENRIYFIFKQKTRRKNSQKIQYFRFTRGKFKNIEDYSKSFYQGFISSQIFDKYFSTVLVSQKEKKGLIEKYKPLPELEILKKGERIYF